MERFATTLEHIKRLLTGQAAGGQPITPSPTPIPSVALVVPRPQPEVAAITALISTPTSPRENAGTWMDWFLKLKPLRFAGKVGDDPHDLFIGFKCCFNF